MTSDQIVILTNSLEQDVLKSIHIWSYMDWKQV